MTDKEILKEQSNILKILNILEFRFPIIDWYEIDHLISINLDLHWEMDERKRYDMI